MCNVLKKVATDPTLLDLEADGVDHGLVAEENGGIDHRYGTKAR
jgi:hypothetical protein